MDFRDFIQLRGRRGADRSARGMGFDQGRELKCGIRFDQGMKYDKRSPYRYRKSVQERECQREILAREGILPAGEFTGAANFSFFDRGWVWMN